MEWTDEGIVLGVRRHGESSAIVELRRVRTPSPRCLVRALEQADAADAAARHSVRAVWRRGSTSTSLLRHGGHAAARGHRAFVIACSMRTFGSLARLLPRAHPHETSTSMLERTLDDFDECQPGRRISSSSNCDAGRTRLRSIWKTARNRRDSIYLRVAEIRRPVVAAGGEPFRDGCCGCRVFARRRGRSERLVGQTCRTAFA